MIPVITRDICSSDRSQTPIDDADLITLVQGLSPGDSRREAACENSLPDTGQLCIVARSVMPLMMIWRKIWFKPVMSDC
jgi:hypothetical protein